MVIRELKPSQRVEGRWLAVLEDGSILRLGEGEVVRFALYAGKELTDQEALDIQDCARRSGLKEKALALLTRKPQSRRELGRKLREWEASDQEAEAICDRLEELGYLNDSQYAALVVRHYAARGYGEKKLRDELYRRGVPRALWEDALDQLEGPEGGHRRLPGQEAVRRPGRPQGRPEGRRRPGPPGLLLVRHPGGPAPLGGGGGGLIQDGQGQVHPKTDPRPESGLFLPAAGLDPGILILLDKLDPHGLLEFFLQPVKVIFCPLEFQCPGTFHGLHTVAVQGEQIVVLHGQESFPVT